MTVGSDAIIAELKANGGPVTRERYIAFRYFGNPPDELSAEEENEIPDYPWDDGAVTDAFDPDEPRDASGRWSAEGGAADLAKEHGVPFGERDLARPVYLRVSAWNPKHEQSGNYAKGESEAGLSTYDLDKKGEPIAPEESEWAEDDLRDRLKSDEPKFLVQGDLVGQGGDGEPLLQNVKVVGVYERKS